MNHRQFTRMSWGMAALAAVIPLLSLPIVAGCGSSTAPSPGVVAATGRATLTVKWPERSRLIPFAAESIKVRLVNGNTLLGESVLARPAGGGMASTTFDSLPIGSAMVQAWAYPTPGATGTPQAQGQVAVQVVASQTVQVGLTLGSTIDRIEITSATSSPMTVGGTRALAATARNATGDVVITNNSTITWQSDTPSVATVNNAGLVTAVASGQATIRATETESGKTITALLTVNGPIVPITLSAPQSYITGPVHYMVSSDIDGDGNLDIVYGTGDISALFGRGDGTFEPPVELYNTAANLELGAIIDINGDGRLDIAVESQATSLISLINEGGRSFRNGGTTSVGDFSDINAGDLDGDGKVDLAGAQWGGRFKVLKNMGNNTFSVLQDIGVGGIGEGCRIRDLNGDGKPDVVVTFETSTVGRSGFQTYFNNGTGNFTRDDTYNMGTGNMPSLDFGDFNQDGKLDIVSSNYWGHSSCFFTGDGTGKFFNPAYYPTPPYPLTIRVADFDRDGWPDLVTANAGSSHFSVLQNKRDGAFNERLEFPSGGDNTRCCAIGDFNKDGKIDVAFGCENTQTVTVLLNTTP
ncbi:MAG: FG-GAP-like repeat-containing protein [Armatimonas sp.]